MKKLLSRMILRRRIYYTTFVDLYPFFREKGDVKHEKKSEIGQRVSYLRDAFGLGSRMEHPRECHGRGEGQNLG